MTDNELLLAMSEMMDKKLEPIKERLTNIELTQENDILLRLQNIESCYTSIYRRYANGIEEMEMLKSDMEVIKRVVMEHSEKLQKIG